MDLVELQKGVREVGSFNLPLQELIEDLHVSDLTRDGQTFFVHGPLCVIIVHGINWEVRLLGEMVLREK